MYKSLYTLPTLFAKVCGVEVYTNRYPSNEVLLGADSVRQSRRQIYKIIRRHAILPVTRAARNVERLPG